MSSLLPVPVEPRRVAWRVVAFLGFAAGRRVPGAVAAHVAASDEPVWAASDLDARSGLVGAGIMIDPAETCLRDAVLAHIVARLAAAPLSSMAALSGSSGQ